MTEYGQPSWWICPSCECQQNSGCLLYDEEANEYCCMFCGEAFSCSTWKRAD